MDTVRERHDSRSLGGDLRIHQIVFFVLAFAAPISVVVATMTLAFAMGAGPGLPVSYLAAAVVLAVFAVGYIAMSKEVTDAGAFYVYITRGIEPVVGVAAAITAVLTYLTLTTGLIIAFGFFASAIFGNLFHIHLDWATWAFIGIIFIGVLGYFNIEGSARLLGVALTLEVAAILIFGLLVMFKGGWIPSLPATSFNPSTVMSGEIAAGITFAFLSFVGIEATVIFKEESHDPDRTIPRATFLAIGLIGAFYIFSSRVIVGAHGPIGLQEGAKGNIDGFVFALMAKFGGTMLLKATQILVVISLFAVSLAAHNSVARYLFSLGRVGVLPGKIANVRAKSQAPFAASACVTALNIVLVIAIMISGIDPYLGFAAPLIALGTLGILSLQVVTSVAVIRYFRKRRDPRIVTTVIAPGLAVIGLAMAFYLVITRFDVISGGADYAFLAFLPLSLLLSAALGAGRALWIRWRQPKLFTQLSTL